MQVQHAALQGAFQSKAPKPDTMNPFACRPEIQVRHTAFKRGSAYLERYCLLIAFTAYLEDCRRRQLSTTFEDWMASRPDLGQARNSILDNPAGVRAQCGILRRCCQGSRR